MASSTTRVTVVNTAAETVLCDISLAALAAGGVLTFDVWGDILNTQAAISYTFRLRLGGLTGTLLFDMAAQSLSQGATPRAWSGRVTLAGVDGSTADLTMTFGYGPIGAPSRLSTPTLLNGTSLAVAGFGAATSLTLTAQMASASANANARLAGYFLRKLA